jgi:hypothetical protein
VRDPGDLGPMVSSCSINTGCIHSIMVSGQGLAYNGLLDY